MGSTATLRSDTARTGTNPDFPIGSNPWRKYVSIDLGAPVRAGVLVIENWHFTAGPHNGENHTLVLVSTTTNEIYCYGEGSLLQNGAAATPLWKTSLNLAPITRGGSNIAPPIGVCGTPVVDTANRRMFVVAGWEAGGVGAYSILQLELDTGTITNSQKLVDPGAPGRASFDGNTVDQRTAINLVDDWLWFGFADFLAYDEGRYYGWVVAVAANDLSQQLYQPMISLKSSQDWGVFAGGVWGPGGVAAAQDGSVYALTGNATQLAASDAGGTSPNDDLTSFGKNYWGSIPAAGPGSLGDYFNALVRVGLEYAGKTPSLKVLDWFQGSTFTQTENTADFDFGGSSPVVLPPIDGRQLVAFVPKNGDVFVLDTQHLGNYTVPLTRQTFANALAAGGNDTKVAIAYVQTPDGRSLLIVGADSNGSLGGFAAFQLDATATPPTLTQVWKSPFQLRDSFGSPTVIANPVSDPANPPTPFGLAWVIDGDDAGNNYLQNVALRAYDVTGGAVAYDSTIGGDITEQIPHFTPITSGGNSVFCTTSAGFMGFTQFPVAAKSLTFIVDRSTFGRDEVDALQTTPAKTADFGSAYWIAVSGVLPSDLGLNTGNLASPPRSPTVTATLDPSLPAPVRNAITSMLQAGKFTGPVIPEDPALPDEPQSFLFPYTVSFKGDAGFSAMAGAVPRIGSTLVTLDASLAVGGTTLGNSAEIELVTGADPFFVDVNPKDPTQPTWLSFDLRFFKVTANALRFGAQAPSDASGAPAYIANVIANLNANQGSVGADSFDALPHDEDGSALEFNPANNDSEAVFNFALARVRLLGKTTGPTPYPVRVFFRLFQAQTATSDFNTSTTYRFATDGTPHGRKIPLLGVQNDQNGQPEYVTIPCFATTRKNLAGPADMQAQDDPPNAYPITVTTPGVAVESYFGCWLDINQPQQKFLPVSPPAGNFDGPWTTQWASHQLQSIQQAIVAAPHQCLIAELRYDDAPVVAGATSATSDKLAQRNIAWIDGPNPGVVASRRMAHPVQIRPTPRGSSTPDELMITWGRTPIGSIAQLYLPALDANAIASLAGQLHPAQRTTLIDAHSIEFDAKGASFIPLPQGAALAAGLLTVTLPPGIRKGDQYDITVRQLTSATRASAAPSPPVQIQDETNGVQRAAVALPPTWRRVIGAFQFVINIKTKQAILLNEERLLATLRWMALGMPTAKRWYPVLQRYIDYVAGRVQGFGGDPSGILPSPTGWVPGLPAPCPKPHPVPLPETGEEEICGKIEALIYDHFGDFEGFVIGTECGKWRRVNSRERAVRDVALQAQRDRDRVVAVVTPHPHRLCRLSVF